MRTRLPLRSTSVIASFEDSDIAKTTNDSNADLTTSESGTIQIYVVVSRKRIRCDVNVKKNSGRGKSQRAPALVGLRRSINTGFENQDFKTHLEQNSDRKSRKAKLINCRLAFKGWSATSINLPNAMHVEIPHKSIHEAMQHLQTRYAHSISLFPSL